MLHYLSVHTGPRISPKFSPKVESNDNFVLLPRKIIADPAVRVYGWKWMNDRVKWRLGILSYVLVKALRAYCSSCMWLRMHYMRITVYFFFDVIANQDTRLYRDYYARYVDMVLRCAEDFSRRLDSGIRTWTRQGMPTLTKVARAATKPRNFIGWKRIC